MRHTLISGLLLASAMFPSFAQAADSHIHEGDIQPTIVSSKIVVPSAIAETSTGYAIFEGDFGDLVKGPYKTSSPGFNTFDFAPGTIVSYTAVGSLGFWDGTAWDNLVPANEYVQLDGNLGEVTRWTTSGPTGDVTGLLGQADGGELHEHLDFSVARFGGGTPTIGAYRIGMYLSAASYTNSDTFYLVLNRGLTSENFELSIDAMTAAVPEPSTYALTMVGLVLIGVQARRRRQQA
jgi:PEP-CTERM motif